jgi:hypothetical protein
VRQTEGLLDKQTIAAATRYADFLSYISNGNWPDDFYILEGEYVVIDCGDKPEPVAPFGWRFFYRLRSLMLDAIVIKNESKRPIRLERLLGWRSAQMGLRIAPISSPTELMQSIADLTEVVAPSESLLIPAQIIFGPPTSFLKDAGSVSDNIHRRKGARGFPANSSSYGVPTFSTYHYGPDLVLGGLVVDGTAIDFAKRERNFTVLSVSGAAGSCPYLLSWNGDTWVNLGKILDRAPSKGREYTETRTFNGLRSRFRIEEREAEVALIDQAQLILFLRNGTSLALQPAHSDLFHRDGKYLQLMWGSAVDLTFELPEGVLQNDVAKSQLNITGYYRRYATIRAMQDRSERTGIGSNAIKASFSPNSDRSNVGDAMCLGSSSVTLKSGAP